MVECFALGGLALIEDHSAAFSRSYDSKRQRHCENRRICFYHKTEVSNSDQLLLRV